MALHEVYSHALRQRYRAPALSLASAFQAVTLLATIILPLLIAYWSGGLWVKTATYLEQPEVHFKQQFVLFIQGDVEGEYQVWSTVPSLNALSADRLVPATVSSRTSDHNSDGLPDQLDISVTWPLRPSMAAVRTVRAAFVIDCTLQLQSRLRMESLAVLEADSPHFRRGAAALRASGALRVSQAAPLRPYGVDTRYDTAAIDGRHADDWPQLMALYDTRNVSTRVERQRQEWSPAADAQVDQFQLHYTLRIGEQQFTYYTGFWQLVKLAWVQYLSIVLIFAFVFMRIREAAFSGRFVHAIPMPVHFYSYSNDRDRG